MPASRTHNCLTITVPHGVRFAQHGSDMQVEFQRGREREVAEWIHKCIDTVFIPEAIQYEELDAKRREYDASPEEHKKALEKFAPKVVEQLKSMVPVVQPAGAAAHTTQSAQQIQWEEQERKKAIEAQIAKQEEINRELAATRAREEEERKASAPVAPNGTTRL